MTITSDPGTYGHPLIKTPNLDKLAAQDGPDGPNEWRLNERQIPSRGGKRNDWSRLL